jgi:hypothetical protein
MAFCPGCGAAVSASNQITSAPVTGIVSGTAGDYRIYITGLGTASRSNVIDLLEDALGYNTYTATLMVNNIPVQIAGNLSLQQAAVIAQTFEEYGVLISVTNGDTAADISSYTSSASLFNNDGSFLSSAAMILASITAANRLRMITKPKSPSILERIFHSLFHTRRKPPVHVRRHVHQSFGPVIRTAPQPPRRQVPPASHPSHRPARPGASRTRPTFSRTGGRRRGPGR